jgi:hypothetical protein
VIVRLLCICSVLVPLFAGVAFGEGTYQRTKDGKTIVWNNDPKPGDAAAWFGDRDRERYATKVGTLTWYTADGAVYVRYFGNMVRGKFNGMVNVHFKGQTDHAIFVDGQQTTRWAAGRAPSRRVAQLPALRPAKPAVAAEAPAEGPPTVRKTENAQRPALSATRVAPTRLRNSTPKPVREQAARPTPNSESVPEQVAQPPIEDTPAKELSEQQARPGNPAVISKPTSAELPPTNSPARQAGVTEPEAPTEGPGVVPAESVLATSANRQTRRGEASPSSGEQPATPSSQSFPEQAAQRPIEDTPAKKLSEQRAGPATPAVISKPTSAVLSPTNSPARQAGVAEAEPPAEGPGVVQAESALATASSSPGEQPATPSSQSFPEQAAQPPMEDTPAVLIQPPEKSVSTPPTSKKSQAEVEDSLQSLARPPSSLHAVPEIAASPEASPRLTKAEVINIANAKARTHGYNRTDYRRPEPQYNAAYKIWSVPYERRVVDGMEEAGEHFSVIVDDKTKGTVLLLRR